MFARTERLLLRPGWAEDAPALAAAIADEMIVRNLATAPWPYRLARRGSLPRPAARPGPAVLPDLRADRGRAPARRLMRARQTPFGRGRARLLDRAPYLGPRIRHRGGIGADRHRPDARLHAARRLALPRQSGVRPGARKARLRAARDHRAAAELRARHRGAGAVAAADAWPTMLVEEDEALAA